MKMSQNGIELLKKLEGFSSKAYKCSAGVLTIGYGHVIKPNEKFKTITKLQAEELLKSDIQWAEDSVAKLILVELNQNQFDALVCFVFNIGAEAFKKSTLRALINSKHYNLAANQFDKWVFAAGKKVAGLENRRAAEKALYLS